MNDRFKFRLWDSDNDIFDYIDLTDIKETIRTLDSYENYFWSDYFKNKSEYIMQCTGLKDKNGKLIYEGDIVKEILTDFINEEIIIVVKWDKLNTMYNLENLQNCEREVIGNIYENVNLTENEVG